MEPWIQTHSGIAFTFLNPKPDQIDIKDIAHALGQLCRFNGHTRTFYSVAEHCVRMSWAVKPEAALWALLHDAGEAYISDVPSPMKDLVRPLVAVEDNILEIIRDKYITNALHCPTFSDAVRDEVHACDKWIVHQEANLLMGPKPQDWGWKSDYTPHGPWRPNPYDLGWSPARASRLYLERFRELTE